MRTGLGKNFCGGVRKRSGRTRFLKTFLSDRNNIMEMKVADVIVKCLEAEGIEYAFGISGSHYIAFFKALKNSSIKFISVKHEGAAGYMASHYARIAQKPALILGTAGPGAMNLLNGIAELYKSNLPAFVLTPTVATHLHGKHALQEDTGFGNTYSFAKIIREVTKKSITCIHPQNIESYMQDLFRHMLSGRKMPVHLLMPSNFFEQTVDFRSNSPFQYRDVDESGFEPDAIDRIAKMLQSSRRPLLFVGNRAWYPNASASITALSQTFGIPVILSGSAKGLFDENSPYFGGILDIYGHRSAEVFVKKSDLVISLGEDFGEFTTLKFEPGLFADKLIQLDIDGYDIGRNYPVLAASCGNIKSMIEAIVHELNASNTPKFFDETFSQEFLHENNTLWEDMREDATPPKSPRIFKEIADLLPPEAVVYSEMGMAGFNALRHLRVSGGANSSSMSHYTMGQAVSGCIGGKLASPSQIAISLSGDGSFMMNGMEIATACQYSIPVIWIIMVNRKYGMVETAHKLLYQDLDFSTDIYVPELSKLAESFSINYFKVLDISSLKSNFLKALEFYKESNESSLIEIISNTDDVLPLKPRLVKMIEDIATTEDAGKSAYLMKGFKRMLREKV